MNKDYMTQVAKMFNKKLGEEFTLNETENNLKFKFTEHGVEDDKGYAYCTILSDLLTGVKTINYDLRKLVLIKPDKAGSTMKIVDCPKKLTLDYMQTFVLGNIEIPYISKKLAEANIDVVINEDGKLINEQPSVMVVDGKKVLDTLVGNVMFCSHDEDGNSIGLTNEQVKVIKKMFTKGLMALISKDCVKILPCIEF